MNKIQINLREQKFEQILHDNDNCVRQFLNQMIQRSGLLVRIVNSYEKGKIIVDITQWAFSVHKMHIM